MKIPEPLLPTLRALVSRLVPTDHNPGALELGAVEFIQERMAERPDLLVVYERGLCALADQGFLELSPEEQDSMLRVFEQRYPEFLPLAALHAVEAVYTHPAGLGMVGFEVTA